MNITQHTTSGGAELSWRVDPAACAAVAPWAARSPAALAADLEGMATYFPHWLLVGVQQGRPARCPGCALPAVPTSGALRCPACGAPLAADGLMWVGQLPALARPEPAFKRRLAALRAAGFPDVEVAGATYILAPLSVTYPAEWPNVEPAARYGGRWLDALGLPRSSAAHHLVGSGQACIFAWGQWSAMPVHEVIQQRLVNHLASLLKCAAGQRPDQAFIGRIHHDDWRPERA